MTFALDSMVEPTLATPLSPMVSSMHSTCFHVVFSIQAAKISSEMASSSTSIPCSVSSPSSMRTVSTTKVVLRFRPAHSLFHKSRSRQMVPKKRSWRKLVETRQSAQLEEESALLMLAKPSVSVLEQVISPTGPPSRRNITTSLTASNGISPPRRCKISTAKLSLTNCTSFTRNSMAVKIACSSTQSITCMMH